MNWEFVSLKVDVRVENTLYTWIIFSECPYAYVENDFMYGFAYDAVKSA